MTRTTYDIERALEEALAEGGIHMDARGFVKVLREAALATRSEPLPADPVSQLTEAELAELRRGARRRQVAAWRRVAAMSASA